jgi:hypothetical protein
LRTTGDEALPPKPQYFSWNYALELERERGGCGAFVFASTRIDELESAEEIQGVEPGRLAMWREIRDRLVTLHSVEGRVLH